MKHLPQHKVALVLDTVYYNATHSNQKSFREIASQLNISYQPFRKVLSHLEDLQLLIIEGERRNTTYRWNGDKSPVNPMMIRHVYELYTGETGNSVTSITKTPKINTELCVKYLTEKGWSGTLVRQHSEGLIQVTESIVVGEA
jgi:predicted transcriptional regulator